MASVGTHCTPGNFATLCSRFRVRGYAQKTPSKSPEMTLVLGVVSLLEVTKPPTATGVVAVAGVLLLAAVLSVFVVSFIFHRRSGRR